MFSTPTHPSRCSDGERLRVLGLVAVVEAEHDRFARWSDAPLRQWACTWSRVTACQPAFLQRLHLRCELGRRHVQSWEGAPGGGAAITWYIRIGTAPAPGWPVP